MSTHVITSLTLDSLDQLSAHARRCVFWEMDPGALHDARGFCDQEFEKEAWLSMVMLEWGSCGQVAVRDGKPLGSALYAPPRMIPRAQLFPTSPVSSDAVLLTSLRLEPSGIEEELGPSLLAAVVTGRAPLLVDRLSGMGGTRFGSLAGDFARTRGTGRAEQGNSCRKRKRAELAHGFSSPEAVQGLGPVERQRIDAACAGKARLLKVK